MRGRLASSPVCSHGCVFLSVWDFDGTLLKGDMTTGLDGAYEGLIQLAISRGYAPKYRPSEYEKFQNDFRAVEAKDGPAAARAFAAQIFRGMPAVRLEKLAEDHFNTKLKNYYFRSSVAMLSGLRQSGVVPCIITASPSFLARPAASSAGVPRENIYGTELEVPRGLISDRIVEPVPYAGGKAARLEMIVRNLEKQTGKPVFVLAAFGNSYVSDGPFLKWTLDQKLPSGKPAAIMINGGPEAGEFKGLFRSVVQESVVGGR